MRKILLSIISIGIAATLLGAATLSYFYDWETSRDNTFIAGEIDLKIDCNSTWWRDYNELGDQVPTLKGEINFPLSDLTAEKFFNWTDIKPGDWGEITLSFHIYSNPAWIWFHINNTFDFENGVTEPESAVDNTPGVLEGELSQYVYTFLWLDEGRIPGFQGKDVDPLEGNNIYDMWIDQGLTMTEPVVYGTPFIENATMHDMYYYVCEWMGPWYIENCTTYYIGWYWWVPTWVGDIIQTDRFVFDLDFYAEQAANNPNPRPPGPYVNQQPVADANGPYEGYVNNMITLDGSGSYDPDGIIMLYEWDFDGDGVYDWSAGTGSQGIADHVYNMIGMYNATLRVTDNKGATDKDNATVRIKKQPFNFPPIAFDDRYSMKEGGVLNVPADGVLANDTDVDGPNPLTAHLVTGVSHGSLYLNTDGSFQYTPDADYHGMDSFTYQAYDGLDYSNVATVNITVVSVNDPPMAYNDSYSMVENTVLNVPADGVLVNDTDTDGPNPLTAHEVTGPSHGTLTLNTDGSFQYTPDTDYTGPDTFTYQAYDGEDYSNVATVFITVTPEVGFTHMGLIPSSDTVNVGDDFTVTCYIDPTEEVGGWAIWLLEFTQGKANATLVSPGPDWATFFDPGEIHNDVGNITGIQTFSVGPYPSTNHTACTIDFTAISPGTCDIVLVEVQVTDTGYNDLMVKTHNTMVTISQPANDPPVADANGPYSDTCPPLDITLDGSGSYDTDGTIVSYEWDLDDDGQFDDATGMNPLTTWNNPGTYPICLRVTDDDGDTDEDCTTVTIDPCNLPPVADANGPYSDTCPPLDITLDGSGSYDTDGTIVSYEWDLDDDGQFDDATGMNPLTTWNNPGTYPICLRVTDDDGDTDEDCTTVTIDPCNLPPVADANGPYSDTCPPLDITLDGSGSYDTDGTIVSYEWDLDDDGQFDDATGMNPLTTWNNPGTYPICLRVTDDDGDTDEDCTTVTIDPCNLPPVADANGPYSDTCPPLDITLDGSGSYDTDGTIVSYEWDLDDDGQFDDATGMNPLTTWNNPGTYPICLRVTDDDGDTDEDCTTVTIDPCADVTIMGLTPSSKTVTVGDTFTITVYIDPTEPIGGWGIWLFNFTQGLADATLVTAGPSWTTFFDAGTINNGAGNITNIQTFSFGPYPDTNHTACTISFTATAAGTCYFELGSVQVTDTAFVEIPVETHNVAITITPP